MFPQMVELLYHLGLACRLPSDGSGELNLLVPWFLTEYPDAVQGLLETLPEDQVQCVFNSVTSKGTQYQSSSIIPCSIV